jgi:hypothetical protein
LSGPAWSALGLVVMLVVAVLVSKANLLPGTLSGLTQTGPATAAASAVSP